MSAGKRVMCEAQHDTPHRKNGNMARTSNKDKAIAYAAERGIILTVEDRDNFDGDYTVEVWSLHSQLSERNSYSHAYFAHGTAEPHAWADALAYMERLTECPADCICRDQLWNDPAQRRGHVQRYPTDQLTATSRTVETA